MNADWVRSGLEARVRLMRLVGARVIHWPILLRTAWAEGRLSVNFDRFLVMGQFKNSSPWTRKLRLGLGAL